MASKAYRRILRTAFGRYAHQLETQHPRWGWLNVLNVSISVLMELARAKLIQRNTHVARAVPNCRHDHDKPISQCVLDDEQGFLVGELKRQLNSSLITDTHKRGRQIRIGNAEVREHGHHISRQMRIVVRFSSDNAAVCA